MDRQRAAGLGLDHRGEPEVTPRATCPLDRGDHGAATGSEQGLVALEERPRYSLPAGFAAAPVRLGRQLLRLHIKLGELEERADLLDGRLDAHERLPFGVGGNTLFAVSGARAADVPGDAALFLASRLAALLGSSQRRRLHAALTVSAIV